VLDAWRALGCFRPRAVFATGGYASVPVAAAAWLRRIPVLVYLPDVHPGWAVRLIERFSTRIATTSEAALRYLPRKKTVVTGYPVRPDFHAVRREAARERMGVPPKVACILVLGGSSGSRDLNRGLARHLPQFTQLGEVVHSSGPAFAPELRRLAERLPEPNRSRYHLHPYLDDVPAAMAAADICITRAGASVLGELPAASLPAVLVPGPFSDQERNARFLESRGAAVVVPNDRINEKLLPVVHSLLTSPERLIAMRKGMSDLARPDAAARLAKLLLEVAA
jgi:UDP-N-acetylglucosamine--N-acetylmuramyl-(pentapeptide) pyrophosphoryl-undecaprenol N-acetylglucosamine transferase